MIKFIKEQILKGAIYLRPGDTLELTWTDEYRRKTTLVENQIGTHRTITKVGIFEFENEFGMRSGIGGVFGEE